MRSTTLAAAALFLLTVTACGTETPPATTTTTTPTPTTTTTTTSTPTTTTTTAAPVPEVPADGTNLQACQDGTCEVELKTGDVLPVREEQLTVASVTPEGVTFLLPSGAVASLGGTGTVTTAGGTTVEILRNNGTTVLVRVS